jgi:hypothetical protein
MVADETDRVASLAASKSERGRRRVGGPRRRIAGEPEGDFRFNPLQLEPRLCA